MGFRTNADALTALMYGRAEDPRIARFAEATARAVTHAPDAGERISAAAQLLIYKMWWAGDFPGGRALYETFDATVSEGEDLAPLPRLLWWSCAAIVDWQCGDPAECYRKVERGLALAASSGVHVRDFFLLTQGIFCALNQEDWPRAEQYLTRLARTERSHKRLDVMVHHFFRSWYSLGRGDARTALAHAESAWPVAEAIGSMFHKVIVLSALGPARVATGDLEGGERAYRAQLALAKAANNPTFTFIAFCAAAELAMARGDEAALVQAGRADPLREAPRGLSLVLRLAHADDAGPPGVRAPKGDSPRHRAPVDPAAKDPSAEARAGRAGRCRSASRRRAGSS